VTAIGDPWLLDLVLTNLLGNAWKYTRNNEVAVISFSMKEQDGISVYSVQDNGEGFDMEKASQLFTPFQRLHKASEYEGHGIGLATVDRIIKRHGGRCWGVSEPGHGATFFFTLQETPESSTLNKQLA
jgi:signal transduction histidine kinase